MLLAVLFRGFLGGGDGGDGVIFLAILFRDGMFWGWWGSCSLALNRVQLTADNAVNMIFQKVY